MQSICYRLGVNPYTFHSALDIRDIAFLEKLNGERLKQFRDFLKTTLEYYKSANKGTILRLKQLRLNRNTLQFEAQVQLEAFGMLQDRFKTKQCTAAAFCLAYVTFKRRKNNLKYSKKRLNHSILTSQDLLGKMYQDLRTARRYLEGCKEEMNDKSSSEIDIYSLKVKIHLYEGELKKLDDKDSWINDKKWSYDYLNWLIQGLNYLKCEKNEIQKELDRYQGLRPDVFEAAQQLLEMENSFTDYFRKLSEYK